MGETPITLELKPEGEENTELLLTHQLFPTEEEKERHKQGWMSCLDRLEGLFE